MDSPCGLSSDLLYATLGKYGDLTAYELAALCKVSLKQVLCAIHHEGFDVQAFAWDGPGWKYRPRPKVDANRRMPKEVGVFDDTGINKRSPYLTA